MADPLDVTLPAADPLTSAAKATAAATGSAAAASVGVTVVFLGSSLSAVTAALTGTTPPQSFIPSGPGGNAADTDPRSFSVSQADLTAAGLRAPRDGDSLSVTDWGGASYVVTRAFAVPGTGRVTCLCYRPDAPAGPHDAAQLAAALSYTP